MSNPAELIPKELSVFVEGRVGKLYLHHGGPSSLLQIYGVNMREHAEQLGVSTFDAYYFSVCVCVWVCVSTHCCSVKKKKKLTKTLLEISELFTIVKCIVLVLSHIAL